MATESESKAWIVFLMFPVLILLCETFGLSVAQSAVQQHLLESRGRFTDGTAFFTEYKPAGKAGGAYYVRYVFDYNGLRYKGEWQISKAWADAHRRPTKIRVQFLPNNPAVSWPPDVGVHRSLLLKLLFVFFCLLAAGYLGTRVVLAWRRSGLPWSWLAIGLTASSWALAALGAFDFAPFLTVLLALGCLFVAAVISPIVLGPSSVEES